MRTLLLGMTLGTLTFVQALPALPNKADSLKFAMLGNSGTGERQQYQLADQMARLREQFKYDLVILAGGNIYGSERPRDYVNKFEAPYQPLLAAGVKFQAALGKEDSPDQRYYKLFNMEGRLYYSFSPKPGVRFFALNSNSPSPEQMQWLEQQLQSSREPWKIAFFNDDRLRRTFDPLFVKHHVVVLTGKDVGPDRFLAAEIDGDKMFFTAISREGRAVDAGIRRRQ